MKLCWDVRKRNVPSTNILVECLECQGGHSYKPMDLRNNIRRTMIKLEKRQQK